MVHTCAAVYCLVRYRRRAGEGRKTRVRRRHSRAVFGAKLALSVPLSPRATLERCGWRDKGPLAGKRGVSDRVPYARVTVVDAQAAFIDLEVSSFDAWSK